MQDPPLDDPDQPTSHEATVEELEATREKLHTYQQLLKELPEVFERKFIERVRPILERNQHLLEEGHALREQIERALPPGAEGSPGRALLPGMGSRESSGPAAPLGQGSDPASPGSLPLLARGGRRLGLALGGGVTLLAAGFLLAAGLRTAGPLRLSPPPRPLPASGQSAAGQPEILPGEVVLRSRGPSWLEVRSHSNRVLFAGELRSTKRFPIGKGLRIAAGRPDLVLVQTAGTPARKLGSIEEIDWHRVAPPTRR